MAESVKYIIEFRDRFSAKTAKIRENMSKMERSIKKADRAIYKMGERMGKVGDIGMKKLTLPLVGAGTASAVAFAKMETGLVNVINLLDDADVNRFSGDLEMAQKSAVKMGFGVADANKALFDTVSAMGMSGKSMEAFVGAQKLAIAGNTQLGIAVDGITSIVNAFGRENTNVEKVMNALFSAQVKGKTTVEELSSSIGRVAPLARDAGLSVEEMLSTVSALTLGGLSTAESVTSLRAVIKSLLKPTSEGEKAFKALGIPIGKSAVRAEGIVNILEKLNKVSDKYPDILAKVIESQEALVGISALGEDKLDILRDTVKKINKDFQDGTGLQSGYARQMNTLSQQFGRAKGAVISLSSEFGQELAPAVGKAAAKIEKLSESFSALDAGKKGDIVFFSGLIAGFPIVLKGLSMIIAGLKGINLLILKNPILAAGVLGAMAGTALGKRIGEKKEEEARIAREKTRGILSQEQDLQKMANQKTFRPQFNLPPVDFSGMMTINSQPGVVQDFKMNNPDVGVRYAY